MQASALICLFMAVSALAARLKGLGSLKQTQQSSERFMDTLLDRPAVLDHRSRFFFSGERSDTGSKSLPEMQSGLKVEERNFSKVIPVFVEDAKFVGKWMLESPISTGQLFNGFDRTEGTVEITYLVDIANSNRTQLLIMLVNEEYLDGKRVYFLVNLTKSDYDLKNSTFKIKSNSNDKPRQFTLYYQDIFEVEYAKIYPEGSIDLAATSKETGQPFDLLNSTKVEDLVTTVRLSFPDKQWLLTARAELVLEGDRFLGQKLAFAGASLLLIASNVLASYKFDTSTDHFVRANLGYVSCMMLTTLYFQYFGFFMMLILQSLTASVWIYLVFAFTLVMYTTTCYKTSFVVFLNRWVDHPQILENTFRSPKGRFMLFSMLAVMGSYIVTVIFMRYRFYAFFFVALGTFPLVQVGEAYMRVSKDCFTVWLQLLTWWPSLLFAYLTRGSANSFVQLRPMPYFTEIMGSMLVVGTVVNYLQSKLGPKFFVPKRLRAGVHRYVVPFSKLPADVQDNECCICYHTLKLKPTDICDIEASMSSTSSTAMLNSLKSCMRTPCNHYFHEVCLMSWMDKKNVCPICRAEVK